MVKGSGGSCHLAHVNGLFRHLALHDFLHAYRIEELLLKRKWTR